MNGRNTEIQITEVKKYKLQDYRNNQRFTHHSKVTNYSFIQYELWVILNYG